MVAIKDLEMPESCSKCPLFHFYLDINGAIHFICKYGDVDICVDFKNRRNILCPLIEVESEEK